MEWYKISEKEVFQNLSTSKKGLSDDEANQRLAKYGRNEIESKKTVSVLKILADQFMSILIIILILASIISVLVGHVLDAVVIMAIVILNGLFGFVQNYRAEKAIEALRKMAPLKTVVIRNGREKSIDAIELVPGDIVVL